MRDLIFQKDLLSEYLMFSFCTRYHVRGTLCIRDRAPNNVTIKIVTQQDCRIVPEELCETCVFNKGNTRTLPVELENLSAILCDIGTWVTPNFILRSYHLPSRESDADSSGY